MLDSMDSKKASIDRSSVRKPPVKIVILACLCALFSSGAASITVSSDMFQFSVNSFQSYIVLVVTAILFVRLHMDGRLGVRLSVLVVSVLFSLMTVAGILLDCNGTLQMTGMEFPVLRSYTGRLLSLAIALFMFLGYSLFYYLVVAYAYGKLQSLRLARPESKTTIFGFALSFRMCLIVMAVCWVPYVIAFFPGLPTSDTCRQMAQFYGIDGLTLDTHFPFFVSVVYNAIFSIAHAIDQTGCLGLFLLMLSQMVPALLLFSIIVQWIERLNLPRWVTLLSLAFFSLFPLVPIYIMQIGKDTIHAVLLAFFAFQLFMLFFKKERGPIPFEVLLSPLAIGCNALLIALSRNGSIIIVFLCIAVVAILTKRKAFYGIGAGVLALFCIWQLAVVPACEVQNEGSKEMLSMPAQVVVSLVHDDIPMDEDVKEQLNRYFGGNLDGVAEGYVPTWADSTKNYLTISSTAETGDFLRLSLIAASANPLRSLSAALVTTYGAWYPFTYGTYYPEDAPYVMSQDDMWAHPGWIGSYYEYESIYSRVKKPIELVKNLRIVPGISALYSPGFYTWLIIFLIGYSVFAARNRARTLSTLLPFILLIMIMIASPCSSLRYALPMVYSVPLFLAILISGVSGTAKDETISSE